MSGVLGDGDVHNEALFGFPVIARGETKNSVRASRRHRNIDKKEKKSPTSCRWVREECLEERTGSLISLVAFC